MEPGLLVGAYERDNFGDVLFLLATRHVLGQREHIAVAATAGDMRELLGEKIEDYRDYLRGPSRRFLWTVGGETGGTSVHDARLMSSTVGGGVAAAASDVPDYASPYLPRPSRYEATLAAPFIVNSVGVSGIGELTGRRRIETVAALREATFLSVRETASRAALARSRISARLAPDLVHSIRLWHRPSQSRNHGLALVQAKERFIREMGVAGFARSLGRARALDRYHVRLFSAGEAPGHDSTPLLHEVAEEMARLGFGGRVDVSSARTPLEKVDEIASAGLWIGTSLHGLILSTAYSTPRVALELPKLSRYAATWGIPAATNVSLAKLDEGIRASLEKFDATDAEALAQRLSDAAIENARIARAAAEAELTDAEIRVREQSAQQTTRALGKVSRASEFVERNALLARRAWRKAHRTIRRPVDNGPK